MPPSLYQTPNSTAAEAPSSAQPRPLSVRVACYLVLAPFVLSIVTLLPAVGVPHHVGGGVQGAIVWAVYVGFQVFALWLTYSTYRQRNWGRWALFAYVIFGWLLDAIASTTDIDESTLASPFNVTVAAMQVAALWLLFTGPGAKWFSKRKAAVPAEA